MGTKVAAIRAWKTEKPKPGWQSWHRFTSGPSPRSTELVNPKPPAVPATLALTLEQYYAACALIGILGSQSAEPDREWLANWACEMGDVMARKCRSRWKPIRPR